MRGLSQAVYVAVASRPRTRTRPAASCSLRKKGRRARGTLARLSRRRVSLREVGARPSLVLPLRVSRLSRERPPSARPRRTVGSHKLRSTHRVGEPPRERPSRVSVEPRRRPGTSTRFSACLVPAKRLSFGYVGYKWWLWSRLLKPHSALHSSFSGACSFPAPSPD